MAALQKQLELKLKYLAECVTGKLLQVDTLMKGSNSVKSLQVSVLTCAWDVVKYDIFYFFTGQEQWKNTWIALLSRNVVQFVLFLY